MKKYFYILFILIIFLYLNCTSGGAEWALIGTWKTYKITGDAPDDLEETWVISSNDIITIYSTFTDDGTSEFNIFRGTGDVTAEYQAKTISFDFYEFRRYIDGVRTTDRIAKNFIEVFEGPFDYQLINNNSIFIIHCDYSEGEFDRYFVKME